MKFKPLYSWSIVFGLGMLPLFGACGLRSDTTQNITKTPVKAGKIEHIKYRVDTIYVDDCNFDQICRQIPAGLFAPQTNTVLLNYFKTTSNNPKIQNFCRKNIDNMRLVRRHEMEHARKAALTKLRARHSVFARGKIAVMNEIMASGAEIIEAMDYRCDTGRHYPTGKRFILDADRAIDSLMRARNLPYPVDFNDPAVADIVLHYSLQHILGEIRRKKYTTTIKNAMQRPCMVPKYKPNSECNMTDHIIFQPDRDEWGPMWKFDSARGAVNIWNNATPAMRAEFIGNIDSIVQYIAGKNGIILRTHKNKLKSK